MFELWITRAWANQSRLLWLLLPLSGLYGLAMRVRTFCYSWGIMRRYQAPVPVHVIGNITVGGAGKTPFLIALGKHLKARQVRFGVVSRGYGGHYQAPCLVNASMDAAYVGDEPLLIYQALSVPVACARRRRDAILHLLKHHTVDIILVDDGLQHLALCRDMEWVLVDKMRGFGNGFLLPAGYLREPVSALHGKCVVEHLAVDDFDPDTLALTMTLIPGAIYALNTTKTLPVGARILAVSGIAHPKRFFDSARSLGYQVEECTFGDHHAFTIQDFARLPNLPILITQKDAVKIQALNITQDIYVLPVDACFSQGLLDKIGDVIQ